MDEDIYTWGTQAGLSEDVILTLMQQDYNYVSELCQLDEQDINVYFRASGLLSDYDCTALQTALAAVPASLLAPSSVHLESSHGEPAPHSASQGQPSLFSASGDGSVPSGAVCSQIDPDEFLSNHNEEEFEFIHSCMAAAGVMEDAPRQFCSPLQTHSVPTVAEMDVDEGATALDMDIGDSVRLLLLGKTGSGKSTTGNTLLGQKIFNTDIAFGSVTTECERQVGFNRNKRMEIMDSPGLYDTSKSHEEICTIIVQAVAGMHPGPHAILYVIKVGRFTKEEYDAYQRLKALFDEKISRHVILLFTHGDELERQGKSLLEMIQSDSAPDTLKEVFNECGRRCMLFNNVAEDKGSQVDALLQEVQALVTYNGGQPYSCPKYSKIGEGLEEEVNKRMEVFEKKDLQRQKYVQQLEQQTRDAEVAAQITRQEFEDMERQRDREMQQEEKRRQQVEKELQQQLRKQQNNSEKRQQELDRLKKEHKRMEAEQAKRQKEHEKQRRQQIKELEKRQKAFEKERQKMREEERRRDRQRAAEMERLKANVVQRKEPNFLEKAVGFVVNPIRKLFGF